MGDCVKISSSNCKCIYREAEYRTHGPHIQYKTNAMTTASQHKQTECIGYAPFNAGNGQRLFVKHLT